MVNGSSSPEIEEFVSVFNQMSTVVKFANTTLASGDLAAAKKNNVEALTLFTMLENEKGVAIVNNNLGSVHTLQARKLAAKAARENDPVKAGKLMKDAQNVFANAIKNFRLAIEDAELLCAATKRQPNGVSPLHGGEVKVEEIVEDGGNAPADVNAEGDDESASEKALYRQLASRKFNLALCLAAKGKSVVHAGSGSDSNAINQARELLEECIQLTSPDGGGDGTNFNRDAKNDVRRFGYLLELASLERGEQGRSQDAGEALDTAEQVLAPYTVNPNGTREAMLAAATAPTLDIPVSILQQRLLGARAAHCEAFGDPQAAVGHYTQALIGKGDSMDPDVARSSLQGLRRMVSGGNDYGHFFSSKLLFALNLPPTALKDSPESARLAIDNALAKVEKAEKSVRNAKPRGSANTTTVDLCFVMDCTGSVRNIGFFM